MNIPQINSVVRPRASPATLKPGNISLLDLLIQILMKAEKIVSNMKLLEEEYLFHIVNIIIVLRKGYGEAYEKYLLCGINDSLKDI